MAATNPVQPIPRAAIEDAVKDLVTGWNDGGLETGLAPEFANRQRLLDSMVEDVPRDATLRLLSIRSPQTMQQYQGVGQHGTQQRVSIVSVTVTTQIEFHDPGRGLRRLSGDNELTLRVTETLGR